MLAKSLIRKMNMTDRSQVRDGATMLFFTTAAVSYWNYRERIRKDFLRSEGHYRFSNMTENVTPWK